MSLPKTALETHLPPLDDLLLDEIALFETGGFSVKAFKDFLAKYTNWTAAQAGRLTVSEMRTVTAQLSEKVFLAAVPKENGASS
jgi:hypothetical protein